jgi:isochorismate hydrolase
MPHRAACDSPPNEFAAAGRARTLERRCLPELDYRATDALLIKKRYSAFFGTDLEERLRTRGCSKLIVCGINTHACVRTTVVDAYQRDLEVILVEGCIDSHDANITPSRGAT